MGWSITGRSIPNTWTSSTVGRMVTEKVSEGVDEEDRRKALTEERAGVRKLIEHVIPNIYWNQ